MLLMICCYFSLVFKAKMHYSIHFTITIRASLVHQYNTSSSVELTEMH